MTPRSSTALTIECEDPRLADLVDAITEKLQAGQPIDLPQYAAEFPEYAEQLDNWVAALKAIVDLGESFSSAGSRVVRGSPDPAHPVSIVSPGGYPASSSGTLGDFRIVREIGRGGMGVVYEAEQISLKRRVALKVLPFAAVLEPRQLLRFQHEAQAAAMLKHPNIVSVHAVGSDRGVHFYAMELIEGMSLAEVVERQKAGSKEQGAGKEVSGIGCQVSGARVDDTTPMAVHSTLHAPGSLLPAGSPRERFREIARLGIQAAEALHYAHEMGIVHRDIKPSNLLVECTHLAPRDEALTKSHHVEDRPRRTKRDVYTPKLLITDFGLATTQTDAGLSMTGDLLGTLRYMSPEQAAGDRAKIDYRTDIYSLGITLYELVTGQPAFADTDRKVLLRRILEDNLKPPRAIDSPLPRDFETIVLKATAKDPADRYSSMAELADDLRCYLESRPIHSRRASAVTRVSRWLRRHQLATVVAGAVVLVVAVTLAIALDREARLRAESDLERERAQTRAQLAWNVTFSALAPLNEQLNFLPHGRVLQREALDHTIESYRQVLSRLETADSESRLSLAKLLLLRSDNSYHLGRDMGSDCDAAISILERLGATDPENLRFRESLAAAYATRGQHLMTQLRYSDAAVAFKNEWRIRATGVQPDSTLWRNIQLPIAVRELGRPLKAQSLLDSNLPGIYAAERAQGFSTLSLHARMNLIKTLIDLGKLDEAHTVFQDATTIADQLSSDDPTKKHFVEWWQARIRELGAELSSQLGEYENSELLATSAVSTYERLHTLAPELPWLVSDIAAGYRHLSDALVLQNKINEADAALVEAIRNGRAADNIIAQFHAGVSQFRRAQLLATLARNEEAADAATAALGEFAETSRRLPNEPYCNHRLIIVLTMSPLVEFRDPDRALRLASQLSADAGGFHWRCLALAQYRAGDYRAAVDSAHEAMARLQGGDSIDWMILAMALWRNGERMEARRRFENAVQRIELRGPVLFGDMGPLAIDQLREEAETLMIDAR